MGGQLGPKWWHEYGDKFGNAKLIDDPLSVTAEASAARFVIDTIDIQGVLHTRFRYRVGQWGAKAHDPDAPLYIGTQGIICDEWPTWLVFAFCLREFGTYYPAKSSLPVDREFALRVELYEEKYSKLSISFIKEYEPLGLQTDANEYFSVYGRRPDEDEFIGAKGVPCLTLGVFARQGRFFRIGRFLNIPHPGIGHDGDPNISIELCGKVVKSVSQFVTKYLALKYASLKCVQLDISSD